MSKATGKKNVKRSDQRYKKSHKSLQWGMAIWMKSSITVYINIVIYQDF